LRKLHRPDPPECLQLNAAAWTENFVVRRRAKPAARFTWRGTGCYAAMRRTLFGMTGDRCAFCDGPVWLESRATIEHFKPKRDFPALAYEWTNLFPSCDMCQSNKREDFDERLLKPDVEDYSFSRYFIANFRTGELEPSPDATEEDAARVTETIRLYGLNSPQRKAARRREWENFRRHEEPNINDFYYRFFLE
jgi:uncharacterized protein (TIGR02646 family)